VRTRNRELFEDGTGFARCIAPEICRDPEVVGLSIASRTTKAAVMPTALYS